MIIKNSNIRRNLFENRYVIFVIIFAIILVLSLIQVLNKNAKEQAEIISNEIQNTVQSTQQEDSSTSTPIISGENVDTKQQKENTEIIDQFINYCNNQEIEKAYNLLTNECKEEIFFSNIQYFKQNYVDKIFTSKKMISMQSWITSYDTYTYKIKILDDMLSSGKVTSAQDAIEDYYTVIEQADGYKLNINGYISRQEINQEIQVNGIKVTIVCKDIYKEYESYDIKIENTTLNTILLDSGEKVDSIYLVGANESHYGAYSYEIDKTNLIVQPNETKTITMHFYKLYSNTTIMEKIIFEDIVMEYEVYETYENKAEYTNRTKISIDI